MNYQGRVQKLRLCPLAAQTNADDTAGDAAHCWSWAGDNGTNWTGSYSINGWFYPYKGGTEVWFPGDEAECFGSDTAVQYPSTTPFFQDAIWPDCWPQATDLPTPDLYDGGTANGEEMQRILIARHGGFAPGVAPRQARLTVPLPGAINIAFADQHAEVWPLEKLWSLTWHYGYVAPAIRPR
jgi:hypothetical protein